MPIGTAVATTFMALGFLATWRSDRDRFWLVIGLGVLGSTAFALVRYGLHGVIIEGPISGSMALASLLLGSLSWAQLLGLPRRLACLLGIGLKSRALVFDNRLLDLGRPFDTAIRLAQEDHEHRPQALILAQGQVRRMRALRPPDTAWALLRDEIADDHQEWIDLLRKDVPPDRIAHHAEGFAPVMTRWVQMREQAARDQRLLVNPARRRRAEVVWLASVAFSGLLIGVTQVRGDDLFALRLTDPGVLLAVGALAFGGVALVGCLVVAVRG